MARTFRNINGPIAFLTTVSLLLFCFVIFSAFANAVDFPTTPIAVPAMTSPKAWPMAFLQAADAEPANVQYKFAAAFYDNGGDQFALYRDDFDAPARFPFQVSRDVYNNFDLFSTWTVVDRLHIHLDEDLLAVSAAVTTATVASDFLSFPFLDLKIGAQGSIDIDDAKQTLPIPLVIAPNDPTSVEASPDDIRDLNPYLSQRPLDGSLKVKLGHLLEPFANIVKIPFSRSEVRKMRPGEVVSYTVSGEIGFAGSLGWKVIPSHVIDVGASVTLATYIDGDFQISVMKDDERYARVRVARLKGHGESLGLSAGARFKDLLKGFFLLKNTALSGALDGVSEQIIPFQVEIAGEQNREIAVSYRYDLNSEAGRDAYHRAVLGSIDHSEAQALAEAGDENPSVTKLYSRSTSSNEHDRSLGINLSFFFSRDAIDSKQAVSTEIQMPDGTSSIFSSISDQARTAHDITGNTEAKSQKLTVSIDQERFRLGQAGGVLLAMENAIEDSQTGGKELNQYAAKIEDYFSDAKLFPVFPEFSPDANRLGKFKKASYGRCSFYYGISLSEVAVSAFLHADESKVAASAGALGIRMDTQAILGARAALDARDPQKLAGALSYLFNDKRHESLYPKLIFATIDANTVDQFMVAEDQLFGTVQYRGHTLLPLETLLRGTGASMGQPVRNETAPANLDSSVANFTAEIGSDQNVVLHFKLSSAPEYLFFHMTPQNGDRHHHEDVDLIVYNRANRFAAGDNTLILDPKSADDLVHRLTAQLSPGETVLVTMGYTPDENSWGVGATTSFQATAAY